MSERKQKKPMTEEQLERLALARQKANEMRKINQAKRLQNKMDNLKYNPDGTLKEGTAPHAENIEEKEVKENVEEKELKENEGVEEEKPQMTITQTTASLEGELQEEEQVIIKKKAKPKKKKQVVIVEQSDDDSDEFESNENVLFVKRVSKNKKQLPPEPPPPPQEYIPPPVRREPPIVPRKTKHELMYDNMFSGGFLNNQFGRRF
jgi:hypothetical protein